MNKTTVFFIFFVGSEKYQWVFFTGTSFYFSVTLNKLPRILKHFEPLITFHGKCRTPFSSFFR